MALVRVKTKYQVTLPYIVRRKIKINIGDLMEAKVEKGKITLAPKTIIDRGIAEGLEDIKQGRVSPAFSSAAAAIRYLHRRAKKLQVKE